MTSKTKKQLVVDRRHGLKAIDSVEHTCKDGRYFIFRSITTRYPDWWKIERLTKDHIIQRISDKDLIYFIPPNIHLKKSYYKYRSEDIPNLNFSNLTHDIKYNIDKVSTRYGSTNVKGWAFIENGENYISNNTTYIVLKNNQSLYIIKTKKYIRPDVVKHFNAKKLINSGMKINFRNIEFDKGFYNLYILILDKNKNHHLVKTHNEININ
jgi:hypothetical protein